MEGPNKHRNGNAGLARAVLRAIVDLVGVARAASVRVGLPERSASAVRASAVVAGANTAQVALRFAPKHALAVGAAGPARATADASSAPVLERTHHHFLRVRVDTDRAAAHILGAVHARAVVAAALAAMVTLRLAAPRTLAVTPAVIPVRGVARAAFVCDVRAEHNTARAVCESRAPGCHQAATARCVVWANNCLGRSNGWPWWFECGAHPLQSTQVLLSPPHLPQKSRCAVPPYTPLQSGRHLSR